MNSGCALYHHYGPYYGKVVDMETKQPLEGAVVLADYYTWLWGSPGGPSVYFLDTQEVVTDKNGEFKIEPLNAFAFRPISTFNSYPGFRIFKPRYECYKYAIPVDRYATIELRELKTKEERLENLACYPTAVPSQAMKRMLELNRLERIDLGLKP